MRPWPKEKAPTRGTIRGCFEALAAAFEADPEATFVAGEALGLVLVAGPVRPGGAGYRLRKLVKEMGGTMQVVTDWRQLADASVAASEPARDTPTTGALQRPSPESALARPGGGTTR